MVESNLANSSESRFLMVTCGYTLATFKEVAYCNAKKSLVFRKSVGD